MSVEKIDDILKEYEEDLKRAMLCLSSQDHLKHITDTAKEMKYAVDIPTASEEAFEKLRFNQYDLIIIDENFGGKGAAGNEFLKHVQYLPMTTRRYIFVALIGSSFKSLDNMAAFERSVNVVINEKDIANIRLILRRSIADNDQFYKVFKESLHKFGKA